MKNFFLFLILSSVVIDANALVKLPKLFGDNMVLQRNKQIPVWGWADAGEKVTVRFNQQSKQVKVGKDGKWMVKLGAETAGGPYVLAVSGKNKLVVNNILVGEVWICSGQSNMEMNVNSSLNAANEKSSANFPQIRHIKVSNTIADKPADDIGSGKWEVASPATVGSFTAVGYFFARRLYQELNVPIGLVNASWGGTMVETWISREALEGNEQFRNSFSGVTFNDINALNEKAYQQSMRAIETAQGALPANTDAAQFNSMQVDDSKWKKLSLPADFSAAGLGNFDGKVWFRKEISLPKSSADQAGTLNLSTIDDADETYVNGKLVGRSDGYNIIRSYPVPAGLLKEGKNIIAVRVSDFSGNGGFYGKPSDLNLVIGNKPTELAGDWGYRIESINRNNVSPNDYPTLLFNGMINPLIPFAIKGALWYQGESNAGRAVQYRESFPLMITDWRQRFQQGDFPFYFVQLASFIAGNGNSEKGSTWAELRESQTATLSMPNTGMAVTLDIGETDDIHPKNKQDVGFRLADIALAKLYDKKQEYSGPVFSNMRVEGNKAILSFTHADKGFMVKDPYQYIRGFVIAGADEKFYFAKAEIVGNNIVVHCDSVKVPVAVRYGWQDDMPEANLYNKEALPTVPFRTDKWKRITENVKYTVSVPK